MKVKVLFFASIRELVGKSEVVLIIERGSNLAELLVQLEQNLGQACWEKLQSKLYKIAINQQIVEHIDKLDEGDELAFLPQVTGG